MRKVKLIANGDLERLEAQLTQEAFGWAVDAQDILRTEENGGSAGLLASVACCLASANAYLEALELIQSHAKVGRTC